MNKRVERQQFWGHGIRSGRKRKENDYSKKRLFFKFFFFFLYREVGRKRSPKKEREGKGRGIKPSPTPPLSHSDKTTTKKAVGKRGKKARERETERKKVTRTRARNAGTFQKELPWVTFSQKVDQIVKLKLNKKVHRDKLTSDQEASTTKKRKKQRGSRKCKHLKAKLKSHFRKLANTFWQLRQ